MMKRQIVKNTYDILERKYEGGSNIIRIDQSSENTAKTIYKFQKDDSLYAVCHERYKDGTSCYVVTKDEKDVKSKHDLQEVYTHARGIFIPTDPNLKKALSDMSKKALEKIYKNIEDESDKEV